jgi:hypothetical protein
MCVRVLHVRVTANKPEVAWAWACARACACTCGYACASVCVCVSMFAGLRYDTGACVRVSVWVRGCVCVRVLCNCMSINVWDVTSVRMASAWSPT